MSSRMTMKTYFVRETRLCSRQSDILPCNLQSGQHHVSVMGMLKYHTMQAAYQAAISTWQRTPQHGFQARGFHIPLVETRTAMLACHLTCLASVCVKSQVTRLWTIPTKLRYLYGRCQVSTGHFMVLLLGSNKVPFENVHSLHQIFVGSTVSALIPRSPPGKLI